MKHRCELRFRSNRAFTHASLRAFPFALARLFLFVAVVQNIVCNTQRNKMREIKLNRAEKRELTENARDSLEMPETWQRCFF